LHTRLCTSHEWLKALTSHVVAGIKTHLGKSAELWLSSRTVRALDATDIQEPGSSGTNWRLHYSLRLPELCCDFFELTDVHGGESLRRLPVAAGDLVLVARGYNDRRAVSQVLGQGGDVILRLHSSAFPLLDPRGAPFDPLPGLRKLKIGQTREWAVSFAPPKGERHHARLCALRKSPQQAALARRKAQRKARHRGRAIGARALEYADFVLVLTTVGAAEMKLPMVLEFYQARWQVELAFKRLKSLLELGQVPKKKAESCQAWMQGQILTALLIERLLCEARFFSPWGYQL
jgi:hypothetical protein